MIREQTLLALIEEDIVEFWRDYRICRSDPTVPRHEVETFKVRLLRSLRMRRYELKRRRR